MCPLSLGTKNGSLTLGRKHVIALYEEGVEMPTDYSGVIYIPIDKSERWNLEIAKEIKARGINVDISLAI